VPIALVVAAVIILASWGTIELSQAPGTSTSSTPGALNPVGAPTLTNTVTTTTGGDGPPVIQPPIRNITRTMTGVNANATCASVPASSVYQAYQKNITAANLRYGGKTMCLSGEIVGVTNFESGVHESCTAQEPEVAFLYGNGCATDSGVPPNDLASYIVWFWNGTAGQMGVENGPSSVVGNCTVSGLLDGNLILKGCYMVDVISTINTINCCGLAITGGVVVSNVTLYVSKQDTASVVNMTVHVLNPSGNEPSFWQVDIPGYLNMSALIGQSEPIGISHFAPPNSSLTLNATIPRSFFGPSLPSPGQPINATIYFGYGYGSGEFGDTDHGGTITLPATVVWYTRPVFGHAELSIAAGGLKAADFRSAGSTPTFSCARTVYPFLNLTDASASHFTITNKGLASTKIVDVEVNYGSETFRYTPASTCFIDKVGSADATMTLFFPPTSYFPRDAAFGQSFTVLIILATGDTVSFSGSFG
jgi:hypothetical protein